MQVVMPSRFEASWSVYQHLTRRAQPQCTCPPVPCGGPCGAWLQYQKEKTSRRRDRKGFRRVERPGWVFAGVWAGTEAEGEEAVVVWRFLWHGGGKGVETLSSPPWEDGVGAWRKIFRTVRLRREFGNGVWEWGFSSVCFQVECRATQKEKRKRNKTEFYIYPSKNWNYLFLMF